MDEGVDIEMEKEMGEEQGLETGYAFAVPDLYRLPSSSPFSSLLVRRGGCGCGQRIGGDGDGDDGNERVGGRLRLVEVPALDGD